MATDPDVSANSVSEGKPLIVTVYDPSSTLAKEYAPPPTVAVDNPLLSDTVTPSRPVPSAVTVPVIEPKIGGRSDSLQAVENAASARVASARLRPLRGRAVPAAEEREALAVPASEEREALAAGRRGAMEWVFMICLPFG